MGKEQCVWGEREGNQWWKGGREGGMVDGKEFPSSSLLKPAWTALHNFCISRIDSKSSHAAKDEQTNRQTDGQMDTLR